MAKEDRTVVKKNNLVYALSRASRCHGCDKKLVRGDVVKLENLKDDKEALCQQCAQLDSFVFVPKGSAKVTKLAAKYSEISYVVMQWSDTWKCYERVGILAQPQAVDKAVNES